MFRGVDVSKHNGPINFNNVKKAGYDFVIIRAGYGKTANQKDLCFEENYFKAKAAGLDVGAYWYSYAVTSEEARLEALACLDTISGKSFDYPIYFDLEERKQLATGKANCSNMVKAFCTEMEKASYFVGLYMSRSHLQTYISDEVSSCYALWIAEYNAKCNYDKPFGMWQKTAKGGVSGIIGDVDIDECYIDYPTLIKAQGLNGFTAKSTSRKKCYLIALGTEYDDYKKAISALSAVLRNYDHTAKVVSFYK